LPHEGSLRRVRAYAWLTRSLSVRSRVRLSAARARAGSMVRVYLSRKAGRPTEYRGRFLPRMRLLH
jgi:hypothetical protein